LLLIHQALNVVLPHAPCNAAGDEHEVVALLAVPPLGTPLRYHLLQVLEPRHKLLHHVHALGKVPQLLQGLLLLQLVLLQLLIQELKKQRAFLFRTAKDHCCKADPYHLLERPL
jgi:hypothetical protein